jgi:type II secretory pathway component PulJ
MIRKNIKGITLIEILIGIVITSIIMGAMLTSYNVVNGSYAQVIDKASIGNSTRTFSEMLLRDIRMAGYKYFDDNLVTETENEMDVPILITKNTSAECCDTMTIIYGDFDRNLVDDKRYIRYKIQYSFQPNPNENGVFQILKSKQKWDGGDWSSSAEDRDTYTNEIVTDYLSDIEIVAKDNLGNVIDPPPSLTDNRDKLYSIYTVEIFLTYRSKKNFYNSNKTRTIVSLYDTERNLEENDKFLRESIILSAYTRNLEAFR